MASRRWSRALRAGVLVSLAGLGASLASGCRHLPWRAEAAESVVSSAVDRGAWWQPSDAPPPVLVSPVPATTAWVGRQLSVVVVPIAQEMVPYDLTTLTHRVIGPATADGTDWPAYVRQASLGRAELHVRVLPWVLAPPTGLPVKSLATIALETADQAVDLSRFADEQGRVRAILVPVTAGLAGIRVGQVAAMPVAYTSIHATQKTIVESVIFLGQAPSTQVLRTLPPPEGPAYLAVLARVLGVQALPLVTGLDRRPVLSPEARAALGWVRLESVTRTQALLVPAVSYADVAAAPGPPTIYKIPVLGATREAVIGLEPYGRGQLRMVRYRLGAHHLPQAIVREDIIPMGSVGMRLSLTDGPDDAASVDRQLTIAWDREVATVQVNLSSTGVERQRATLERTRWP